MNEALVHKGYIHAADVEVRKACDRKVTCYVRSGDYNDATTSTVMKKCSKGYSFPRILAGN